MLLHIFNTFVDYICKIRRCKDNKTLKYQRDKIKLATVPGDSVAKPPLPTSPYKALHSPKIPLFCQYSRKI